MEDTEKKSAFIDNGDGTITDVRHGLMWVKNDTWLELGRLITWHEGLEYSKKMNEQKFAGYNNWRFPTASDARTLFDWEASNIDVQGTEIHLDPIFPSGCGFSTWTSETRGAKAAMGFDLRSNYEFWLAKENEGFPSGLRLVRKIGKKSGDSDEIRFIDNKDGTVTDKVAGLMWKASDSYLELDKWVSWQEAKMYLEEINKRKSSGYSDWRMPTRKEVQMIYDPANPVTDKFGDTVFLVKGFPPGCGQTSWTKTLNKTDKSLAMRFHFYNGDYKWHKQGLRSHGVRPVRTIKD
ncbi:MAG: hypothetical protein NPINA01_23730 [Nitrospinaceae bacterium]|nr:MAG: hypothetical protein NPINA01_23730 [Nitrospinaceae bacterium]